MKRNIRLLLEYDGSRYQGWQRLGKSSVSTTIQGKLEGVLSRMTGEDIQVTGSGRTDAGVHARGQVANFHTDCTLSCREIRDYLTAYLPQDIGVREVTEAKERFHSRLNATSKTYLYRLGLPGYSHVFSRKYIWLLPETPDISRMQKAAALLEGTHDFQGFSSVKKTKKSTVRELYSVTVEQKGPDSHSLSGKRISLQYGADSHRHSGGNRPWPAGTGADFGCIFLSRPGRRRDDRPASGAVPDGSNL